MTVRIDTRLKDWDRTELTSKVLTLLTRRKQIVECGWREDPYAFYLNLYPMEVREAMSAIEFSYGEKFRDVLNSEEQAVVNVVTATGTIYTLGFVFGKSRPSINPGWHNEQGISIKPAHPMHPALLDYCERVDACDALHKLISNLVEHIAEKCNTYGQIHRVWPELLPTIGGAKVQAAENQKRKSSLPSDLDVDAIMSYRDEYTTALAQGALMRADRVVNCWLDP